MIDAKTRSYAGVIDRYRDRLSVADDIRVVSLLEGDTPLVPLPNITRHLGREVALYAKYEGLNPTGSFKDRGMTMAVTMAIHSGSRAILCASTGNTSAAAAAYAARAGIDAFVLIPEGNIALGKLSQAMMHGATVIQIRGNFDDGMALVKELANCAPVTLVNSVNPHRLQGQKTAAFEIVDELGNAPDFHCLPVGNAGNISAYWMGYTEYYENGPATARPRMIGYQAAGAAPFVGGQMLDAPETIASAIRIGRPQSWDYAWAAQRESNGWFAARTDDEILAAQKHLAEREGLFCEPASAVCIAGVLADLEAGTIGDGSTVVCTLTGHGLKDPDVAIDQGGDVVTVESDLDSIKRIIMDQLH